MMDGCAIVIVISLTNPIMSDKPTSCFRAGVSAVDRQGAVLSSFAPLRVEEHLRPPLLPPRSAYHLIACAHPRLLARAHTHSILSNYLTASLLPHTPVVDLCLPFHEQSSGRTYLGRYIIFKGQIVGLRLTVKTQEHHSLHPRTLTRTNISPQLIRQAESILLPFIEYISIMLTLE